MGTFASLPAGWQDIIKRGIQNGVGVRGIADRLGCGSKRTVSLAKQLGLVIPFPRRRCINAVVAKRIARENMDEIWPESRFKKIIP